MNRFVALLRGINVGRAERIAMADLRALFETRECTAIRTLLDSGNVVFGVPRRGAMASNSAIEAAIEKAFGFAAAGVCATVVLRAQAEEAKHAG